jgi:hypothetical protein
MYLSLPGGASNSEIDMSKAVFSGTKRVTFLPFARLFLCTDLLVPL